MVKMMICVVSTFFISWAPLYLVQGYILYYGYPENDDKVCQSDSRKKEKSASL